MGNKVWNFGSGLGAEVSLKDFRKDLIIDVYNEAADHLLHGGDPREHRIASRCVATAASAAGTCGDKTPRPRRSRGPSCRMVKASSPVADMAHVKLQLTGSSLARSRLIEPP